MEEKKVQIQVGKFDLHYLQLENWDGRTLDVYVVGWPVTVKIVNQKTDEIEDQKEMYVGFRLTRALTDKVMNGEELKALEELLKNLGMVYVYELRDQMCEDNEQWRKCGEELRALKAITDSEIVWKFKNELKSLIDRKKTEIDTITKKIEECIISGREECEY